MAYLLLINETRGERAARPEDEAHRLYEDMMAFAASLQADGILQVDRRDFEILDMAGLEDLARDILRD